MTTMENIASYGIDYDDAMDRFGGNVNLYKRLALRYLEDSHFDGCVAAMTVGDYDEAYREAHSLKGVAGNLSFIQLYDVASMVCKNLREGEPVAASRLLEDLESAHRRIREGLLQVDQ